LLCLGKGLVVIFNYIQAAGPLWSEVLFSQQRSGPVPTIGKGPETPRVPEEAGIRAQAAGAPDLPRRPDPCIETGPLTKGRNRHPTSGWSGDATYLQDMAVWVSTQTFTHHCIHCGRWMFALLYQKLRRLIDQGTLLIAYYQGGGATGAAHTASASLP